MSDEAAATPAKPKRRLRDRLVPRTVVGKATLVTSLVLVITWIAVWMLRLFGPESVRLMHAMTWPRILAEVTLVIVIPIVLYWGLNRWHQVIEGEYPDIDRAWEAGMRALSAQGIDPAEYPIFLILGSADQSVERGLMDALETDLTIAGIPDASGVRHALQWYMTADGIYLFCPSASSLSALMGRWTTPAGQSRIHRPALATEHRSGNAAASAAPAAPAAANIRELPAENSQPAVASMTAAAATGASVAAAVSHLPAVAPSANADAFLGTLQFPGSDSPAAGIAAGAAAAAAIPAAAQALKASAGSGESDASRSRPAAPLATPAPAALRPAPKYQGTIALDQWIESGGGENVQPAPPQPAQPSSATKRAPGGNSPPRENGTANATVLAPERRSQPHPELERKQIALPTNLDTSDQIPRLQYVCKLLKRIRRPHCGINGLVTLIPFDLSRVGTLQLSAIAQSARGDVTTVQETLGVRTPVTALLIGLEQDKGFTELTRRLQAGLLSRRLGGRFDLRSRPTPSELNVHSDRLCDAFEDWVYRLFGCDDALAQQRGNRKLFALISRIRHELKPRLRIVLGNAFGCNAENHETPDHQDDSFFFSGCYFAATGADTGRPAFVKGVLRDKLVEEQSQVEWSQPSLRLGRFVRVISLLGWLAVIGLLVALIAQAAA